VIECAVATHEQWITKRHRKIFDVNDKNAEDGKTAKGVDGRNTSSSRARSAVRERGGADGAVSSHLAKSKTVDWRLIPAEGVAGVEA
jgi:hypothetical protein